MSSTSRNGNSPNGAIQLVRIYEPDVERQMQALLALLNTCPDALKESPSVEAAMEISLQAAPVVATTAPEPEAAATAQEPGKGHEEPRK